MKTQELEALSWAGQPNHYAMNVWDTLHKNENLYAYMHLCPKSEFCGRTLNMQMAIQKWGKCEWQHQEMSCAEMIFEVGGCWTGKKKLHICSFTPIESAIKKAYKK